MDYPQQSDSTHVVKRSDLLAFTLFMLGVGMTLLLGPEWGWPFLLAGLVSAVVYLAMWRSNNPAWLNRALIAILAIFVLASAVVIGWKLRPIPAVTAKTTHPPVPRAEDLVRDYANGLREYERLHPSPQRGAARSTLTVQSRAVTSLGQQGGQTAGTINNAPGGIANSGTIRGDATVNNYGAPSYPILDITSQSKLAAALSAQKASVAFSTHNASGSTIAFANTLAGIFHDANWSYSAPGIEISGTDIGPDGRPVPIPTGLHIYAKTQTDATALFVKKQFKDVANIDSVIEPRTNLRGMDIVIFVGEPEVKRTEPEPSRQAK